MSEDLRQHDTPQVKNPARELSNPHGNLVFNHTFGWFKDDYTNSDTRLFYPMQIWGWLRGNDAWTRREPIKPLHRDPKIWEQLDDQTKETFDILGVWGG